MYIHVYTKFRKQLIYIKIFEVTQCMDYTTSLFKNGNATSLRIPKALLHELRLEPGDEVSIDLKNNQLIIESTTPPPPDKTLIQAALTAIKPYFKGDIGHFTEQSEMNYSITKHPSLDIKCYQIPLFNKKETVKFTDIMIPIDYMYNFKQLLSFLYDYILCESDDNHIDQIIYSKRLTMFERWFNESHGTFFKEYDLEKSIYYDYLKERVNNESC